MIELAGTKALIFDAFVEMTSSVGYENVSIRDIARKVGINSASIYYHFENKGEILECAYEYFRERQYDNRTPVEVLKEMIETSEPEEIVRAFTHSFESENEMQYERMVLITKIIYMRLFQDPVANAMFAEIKTNSIEYILTVLEHGVNIGRLNPDFDQETFADVLIDTMRIMGIEAFAAPNYVVGQLDKEARRLALVSKVFASAFS